MANMKYCMFRNTLDDLRDCYENMSYDDDGLSLEEKKAKEKLIQLCCDIALDFGELEE